MTDTAAVPTPTTVPADLHLPAWMWSWIVRVEGTTYVNDLHNGEQSRYGITKATYPHLDIEHLTEREAREIYDRDYWLAMRCGEMPRPVAFALMDTAINTSYIGGKRAVSMLQKALGVQIDGIVGPKTLGAISRAESFGRTPVIVSRFQTERLMYYRDVVRFKPFLGVYLGTWMDRTTLLLYSAEGTRTL